MSAHPLIEFSIFRIPALLAGVTGAFVSFFALAGLQLPAGTPSAAKAGIEEALRVAATLPDRQPLFAAVAGAYDHAFIVATAVIGTRQSISSFYRINLAEI